MEDKTKLKEMLNNKYGISKDFTPIHIIKWDNTIGTILIPKYDRRSNDERANR